METGIAQRAQEKIRSIDVRILTTKGMNTCKLVAATLPAWSRMVPRYTGSMFWGEVVWASWKCVWIVLWNRKVLVGIDLGIAMLFSISRAWVGNIAFSYSGNSVLIGLNFETTKKKRLVIGWWTQLGSGHLPALGDSSKTRPVPQKNKSNTFASTTQPEESTPPNSHPPIPPYTLLLAYT